MLFLTKHTQALKYESAQNDPKKTRKSYNLPWRDKNIGMEQMLLQDASDDGNQNFQKL